ncbi:hypothetical protein HGM15179_017308 [Zosterops borbonicus]|uniref:Uncharacterized protein n=1 Tax=Zosterops borbonicus TaxID=364589 RepID=A0A8K1G165_9PASS|nr:hypothetical protein HGM15179_017308 [Zosterops borbonicus]
MSVLGARESDIPPGKRAVHLSGDQHNPHKPDINTSLIPKVPKTNPCTEPGVEGEYFGGSFSQSSPIVQDEQP